MTSCKKSNIKEFLEVEAISHISLILLECLWTMLQEFWDAISASLSTTSLILQQQPNIKIKINSCPCYYILIILSINHHSTYKLNLCCIDLVKEILKFFIIRISLFNGSNPWLIIKNKGMTLIPYHTSICVSIVHIWWTLLFILYNKYKPYFIYKW